MRFRVNPDWTEPALLWTGIVGAPGIRKTPAIQAATEPLLKLEQELCEVFMANELERERQRLLYDVELRNWKQRAAKGNSTEPPPLQIEVESKPRLWCDDTTIEGLAALLERNPRGLLLRRDELTAFLRSFSEYKGKGGDLQRWLSIHSTQAVAVDRKSADAIHIWRPNVSIVGGIQPRLLQTFFGGEFVDSGLMQRFLFCWPPVKSAKLSRQGVKLQAKKEYSELIRRLQQFPYEDTPVELSLSDQAFEAFNTWFDFIEGEFKPSVEGVLKEVSSKLIAAAVRLAGLMQVATDNHAMEITGDAMRLGIVLARWFLDEWERVYELQDEESERQMNRHLAEFITNKFNGRITPSELCRYRRDITTTAEAEATLVQLASDGWGRFAVTPTEGRPRHEFVIDSHSLSTEAPKTA